MKLTCRPLALTSSKAVFFKKKKKRSGISLPGSFSTWFFKKKYFSCYILLIYQISLSGCLYFVRYWTICVLYFFVNHIVTFKFEINLIYLIKPFFLHVQKVKTKTWISWGRKELLRWNRKHIYHILRAFIKANRTSLFGRWGSDFKSLQNNGKKQLLSMSSEENIFYTTTYNSSSELSYCFS